MNVKNTKLGKGSLIKMTDNELVERAEKVVAIAYDTALAGADLSAYNLIYVNDEGNIKIKPITESVYQSALKEQS